MWFFVSWKIPYDQNIAASVEHSIPKSGDATRADLSLQRVVPLICKHWFLTAHKQCPHDTDDEMSFCRNANE